MMEFLTFRKMITPLFIQIIFWVGTAVIVIAGLVMMVAGAAGSGSTTVQTPLGPVTQSGSGGGMAVLGGLVFILIGPIMWRVYCELLIVIFKIHSELVAIRGAGESSAQGFPVTPLP